MTRLIASQECFGKKTFEKVPLKITSLLGLFPNSKTAYSKRFKVTSVCKIHTHYFKVGKDCNNFTVLTKKKKNFTVLTKCR